MFVVLVCPGGSLVAKCVCLSNQSRISKQTLNNLNLNELYYYPLLVSLDRYHGSCNTVEGPIFTICVPNKIGNAN